MKRLPLFIFLCLMITASIFGTSVCWSENVIQPPNGKELCTKYALFSWDYDPEAVAYQIQIATANEENSFAEPIVDLVDSSLAVIVKEGLDFGNFYLWRTRSISDNREDSEWSATRNFSITDLPDTLRNAFHPEIHNSDLMQPGISIFTPGGTPVGMQADGEIVLYFPGETGWWTRGQHDIRRLPDGDFTTIARGGFRIFNIYNDTLWWQGNYTDEISHHDAFLKSNGNVMMLTNSYYWVPRGEDSLFYRCDNIVEMNMDGEVVWRWRGYDNFSFDDYDTLVYDRVPPGGQLDWTHSNSCTMDENEEFIYLSVRNLSRIVKIAYPSGEIVWSMGQPRPSGDVDFGQDLDFHFQHATDPLDDHRLLFFDNHVSAPAFHSRAIIIDVNPERNPPAEIVWEYATNFAYSMGSAYEQPNGNILINTGSSFSFYEVTPDGELLWEMVSEMHPSNYRLRRIDCLYPYVCLVVAPPDSCGLAYESDVTYKVYNEGELLQQFSYRFSDESGWFEEESGFFDLEPDQSVEFIFHGNLPDVEVWNQLTFELDPVNAPRKRKSYISAVIPGVWRVNSRQSKPLPEMIQLSAIYPNPFNESVRIDLTLPKASSVHLNVYSSDGRLVGSVLDCTLEAGHHNFAWSAEGIPAGVYVVSLDAGGAVAREKVVLVK